MRKFVRYFRPAAASLLLACAFAASALTSRAQTFETVLNTNLFQPAGITVSPDNHYLISDTANHRIVDFRADNRAFKVLAGPDQGTPEPGAVDGKGVDARFRNPQGILSVEDKVYVADSGNHVIRMIDAAGNVTTIAGDLSVAHEVDDFGGLPSNWGFVDGPAATAKFNAPAGLAYDGQGHLYIADSGNHAIRMLDLGAKTVSTVVRSGLTTPVAISLGLNGLVFISDSGAHSIKGWTPGATKAFLIAGGGSPLARGFRNSAIATNALFSAPGGIFYREVTDELIVADSGNGVLRTVQNISGTAPSVSTFANTGSAGYQTPIAVTRDLYGVFLVCDSTRNTLASVITVKFPRINPPQIGYIIVVINQNTGIPEAKLAPVTDQTFDNIVRVAVTGDATAQHHFTYTGSLSESALPVLPTTNDTTVVNFPAPQSPAPADDVLNAESLNATLPPKFNFRIRAFTAPRGVDERIPSLTTEAIFRFKCGTPTLDSQSSPGSLIFRCTTTNAVIYYTLDGSEPIKDGASPKSLKSGESIPLVITTNTMVVKARAYMDDKFIPSDVARAEFSPDNFVPNRISLGFAQGEASTLLRGAPGQRYFAPVTLSLMPNAQAYGLQFNLSLTPKTGPASSDYKLAFDSTLVEKLPETNRVIPPATFVLAGTNLVTNFVTTISTNFTYQVALTNYSAQPTTNYVAFTNKLADVVPVISTITVSNLGQVFQVPTTNYVTNSFQFMGERSITSTNTEVDTNYVYRYVSPSVTNMVRADSTLPDSAPVVVTNFVSNLGQLFSFNTTNYITNSFNLVSSGPVTNTTRTTETNYAYQAVSPAVTNFVSLNRYVPADSEVIVTNFVTNLGQLFPVTTTNHLTSEFDLVSALLATNFTSTVQTNYAYRSVSPGTTTLLTMNELLPERTPVLLTNVLTNLGRLFPVVSTNYISNAFNLLTYSVTSNTTTDVATNYLYEAGVGSQTNILVLDHVLANSTEVITTNFVPNMGDLFPVLSTNRITNSFNLMAANYITNRNARVSTNFLYEVATAPRTNLVELDHVLADRVPLITTNFVLNLGQQFPVLVTNYISNSFNLFSYDVFTNVVTTLSTNFDYRAVTPGQTNYLTLAQILADKTPVVVTNFVTNMGQLFPIPSTNYISNAFNLLSAEVVTNIFAQPSSNYLYEVATPGRTNTIVTDHFVPDHAAILTTNLVANVGELFPVVTTNIVSNNFNLFAVDYLTNTTVTITTNYAYSASIPGKTNLITLNTLLPDSIPVIATNFLNNLGQRFPVTDTNYVTNAFDLLLAEITTNVVSNVSTTFLYRSVSQGVSNYVTVDHLFPDTGPVVTFTTKTNLGNFYTMSSTNIATNVFELVSAQFTTNTVNRASYEYSYPEFLWTNVVLLPAPLSDGSSITTTNTFIVTNDVPGGAVSRFNVVTTHTVDSSDLITLVLDGSDVRYLYSVPSDIPPGTFISSSSLSFPSAIALQASGTSTDAGAFAQDFIYIIGNPVMSTNTNVVGFVNITTNALYRVVAPAITNYLALSTNLPDVAPVVSTVVITNLGQNFTFSVTNYATNVFDLVSTTFATNVQTVVKTNATYAFRTPAITYLLNLTNRLPDFAPVVTTTFVTNLGRLFPVATTNFVPNTFDFLGESYDTNSQTTVRTNVTYVFAEPAVTNYVLWPELLPDIAPILTTNFISNLGRQFPVVQTNYVTNAFRLVSRDFVTNTIVQVATNVVYAFSVPSVTNYLSLPNKLPDSAPVVTTTFLTNLGQLFPINTTNYVANTFEFLGERHTSNAQPTVVTNVAYLFVEPGVTNYIWWPDLLPATASVLSTNFISNLGLQFPVVQTNYFTNGFRLAASSLTTNETPTVTTNIVYEFRTTGATNLITLHEALPDAVPVITTNFVSNLGRLFPVAVTNYLTNTFRLLDVAVVTNTTSGVSTNVTYAFSTPSITNYLNLAEKLPDTLQVITTNFISNLGQLYPVLTTNLARNSFEFLGMDVLTNTDWSVTTNVLYALRIPSVTNLVIWPVKLPDSVALVTTNYITNLGQLFPVLSTNMVANRFQFLYTNYYTSVVESVHSDFWYEFHSPAVTNFFTLDMKLPDSIQVITTNFVTNLGQLFPVKTTNITANVFELLSTNVIRSETTETSTTYVYAVVSPGTGPNVPASVSTNLVTLDHALQEVVPVVTIVGVLTNGTDTIPITVTNYTTNSFKLVGTSFLTNTVLVSRTNVPSVFADLVLTNNTENWLAVGWLERYGQTNLYNSKQQTLISYSQPHNSMFRSVDGGAVAGAFSFIVPTNAAAGDQYTLRVSRASATADGVSQDMFIQAPGEDDLKSPVKAVRTLTVTNEVGYIAGDVSNFRWFNAGEFGDTNLLNNDVTELLQAVVYGLNLPPQDSDFMDAMDTCCVTVDGRDLSDMRYASGGAIDLNEIAFGEGSRYAPLGTRPYAKLEVNDLFLTLRRSLDPTLAWYQRYWGNGTRQARIVPNTFRGEAPLARQSTASSTLVPSGPTVQTDQAPALTVYAGTASGLPGKTVAVPIHARVEGGYPLRALMFNVHVEAADGRLLDTFSLEATPTDALGVPKMLLHDDPALSGAAWLDTSIAGVLGDQVVARVLFTIPADAQPTSVYYVKLDRVSGSPNGISLFPVRSGNGLVAMSNRPTPIWNDGIPDAWRVKYFGTLNDLRSAADVDVDGDGLSNYEEYKLGTNPLDATDSLRVQAKQNGHGVTLKFRSANGKMYKVEASSDLQPGSWLPVLSNVAGTGNDIELPDPGGAHSFYYRVRLQE